ncbi:FKBP-type peptidyl-prolyl cis-trans isomerase [Actinoplanes aureus]|jgi:peptidylprolyl isomerase|uniref:Peptidyl-prolyl cis-trans isomerase n=1 Tax=Actinoplanes aureus TaxID=2792083 RepID=A0A931C7X8_9ACTN|nr:FKBP-type peptidyl-prolyl cis-trans isomerase [Actinoplanes aureus]MBG0562357.1 FKBP-type peptidyl-prolyl cis-trans isomerase [Actinoplanes aureus]
MTDRTGSKSKGLALAVAGGVLVLAVLAGIFFLVQSRDEEPATTQASATQPANPLEVEPEMKPGTGTVDKIVITEIVPGTGAVVQKGQTITVNYKVISYKTGELIDSSWDGGQPFSAQIGVGQLIPGWDQAVPGQKVGSRIQLDVPADLAYGPSKGDLRFVVDILDAK